MAKEHHDKATLDAIARRDEAKAQILAGRAQRTDGDFEKAVTAATKAAVASAKEANAVADEPKDLSGMPQTLSDSAGSFAKDAKEAGIGGIGVVNSNSDPKAAPELDDAEAKAVAAKIKAQKGGK